MFPGCAYGGLLRSKKRQQFPMRPFPIFLLLAASLLISYASAAQALTRCAATSPVTHGIELANSFAGNAAPSQIDAPAAPCSWALGLASLPSGNGTAFIVGNRREVMTALHVVDKHCLGNRRFRFSQGFNRDRTLGTIGATVVAHGDYCPERAGGGHDYGGDWAIAVLDREPARVAHAGDPLVLDSDAMMGGRSAAKRYVLLGYGVQFRGGVQLYRSAPCSIRRHFANLMAEHDCDSNFRSSGAPILVTKGSGPCALAALNTAELAPVAGRTEFKEGINANIAILAPRFAAAVLAVQRDLELGRSVGAIAAELSSQPPSR